MVAGIVTLLIAAAAVALVVSMLRPDTKWVEVSVFLVGLAVLAIVWVKP